MIKSVVGVFCCLIVLSGAASADWKEIDTETERAERDALSDGVRPHWSKSYTVWSDGGRCWGVGRAEAVSPRESVTYTALSNVGLHLTLWRHFPPGVGEVEVRARALMLSEAQSKGPGFAKAAAVGFCSGEFWIDDYFGQARAVVDSGAANTMIEGLPRILIGASATLFGAVTIHASAQIQLVWFAGSGLIPDNDRDYISHFQCPATLFRVRERAQSQIHVWAMGSLTAARGTADCYVNGKATVVYDLLTHRSSCPGR